MLESNGNPTNAQSGERTVEHVESYAVVERINSAAHVVAATKCARNCRAPNLIPKNFISGIEDVFDGGKRGSGDPYLHNSISNGYPTSAQSGERAVEHVESCAVVERNNSADHVDAATQCART